MRSAQPEFFAVSDRVCDHGCRPSRETIAVRVWGLPARISWLR